MGNPRKHIPAKLIVGLISCDPSQFAIVRVVLEKKFGKIDTESALLDFSCTHYYTKELGNSLKRKFFSFKKLIPLEKNYKIKLYTNKIEKKLSKNNFRTINIDPGYITLTNLVLFTTKPQSHRIYLDEGIYGDLELMFAKKSFRPLEWTYPDYRTNEYIGFFNEVRQLYKREINDTR